MSEIEVIHFNGSEEASIREQMVQYYNPETGFDTAWQQAMHIPGDDRRKYFAVLRSLETDLSEGHCFEVKEPLIPARDVATKVKGVATSAVAATTLLVTNCKETIHQRFGANDTER